jgi:hypothetical protein
MDRNEAAGRQKSVLCLVAPGRSDPLGDQDPAEVERTLKGQGNGWQRNDAYEYGIRF